MRMPTDEHGQPSNEPEVDPDLIVDIETWCTRWNSTLSEEYDSLTRFCIGIYQIGQALNSRRRIVGREATGAAILHMLIALTRVNGGIAHILAKRLSDIDVVFSEKNTLYNLCKATQMFFYMKQAYNGSYRKDRVNIKELNLYVATIIANIADLTKPEERGTGINEAAEILLRKAYKE